MADSRARARQDGTGEPYTTALMHVRGQCSPCNGGRKCPGCRTEPCVPCRPICPKRNPKQMSLKELAKALKCQFDDITDGRVLCAYCGGER